MNILVGFGENIQSNPITFNRRNTQMAKNYESENKNSKNSTNRAYESETNSQDCKNSYTKNSSKNKNRNSYESEEDTTSKY